MARKNNFPNNQLNDIDPDFTENVINEALIISADGKPQTTAELHDRIEKYFKTFPKNCCIISIFCIVS